ncbi:hypothetical protein A5906_14165 [Bradyrhizobium sacchari]|uniref:Uncharacterized protein n=1 Tax=Bradyrhizobium sacchari TaxID=1399419 RepID=A0A560KG50_9BRAD|nr:hypothetical protein [Bradyrhizobium sacchari]OPY94454.1 hypothetical protein A5906_14165 [Bradyrhizobium sacchari]TWB64600.1 hypothetical protein FBZ94_102140 [Bradyrhizobium sacchari]TWB80924.1 hypothetical protein FBZ95_102141 [Bradyrhizobium sacchari]
MTSEFVDPLRRPVSIVFVGRNQQGNWVVREQNGTFGGVFVDRTRAIKFVLKSERAEAIIEMSPGLEFATIAEP